MYLMDPESPKRYYLVECLVEEVLRERFVVIGPGFIVLGWSRGYRGSTE